MSLLFSQDQNYDQELAACLGLGERHTWREAYEYRSHLPIIPPKDYMSPPALGGGSGAELAPHFWATSPLSSDSTVNNVDCFGTPRFAVVGETQSDTLGLERQLASFAFFQAPTEPSKELVEGWNTYSPSEKSDGLYETRIVALPEGRNVTQSSPTSQPTTGQPEPSYAALIRRALLSTGDKGKGMTVQEIYAWLEDNTSKVDKTENDWRSSVRHNLSQNKVGTLSQDNL
ncbi:uncharacterized protein B0I36DRAFT_356255 [Microdochium trichocladiopsis]|uniref:Fork-head domain-containing protein n=1 Tax=Microdochium trichocladiopsis TaxID=1682393 RepID=A0A9P9BHQ7_9PEZI|nr:uncharacterized protein B0I36DRAFT_356255 [Microdochium trichocladiopsis]KAH7012166.1 hypothetical protein B0I36DRAFT_356255 [Microdochium trichocladiopsis]